MSTEIEIGRCTITEKLRFIGHVVGGGAGGPGKVLMYTGWETGRNVRWDRESMSHSGRSGSRVWQLEADQLYKIDDVAISSRKTDTFYTKTCGI